MSINADIVAERWVVPAKGGKAEIQRELFHVWQTPTRVSWEMQDAADPIAVYRRWVLSQSVYDDRGSEGLKDCNRHLFELNEWMVDKVARGFDIHVEVG